MNLTLKLATGSHCFDRRPTMQPGNYALDQATVFEYSTGLMLKPERLKFWLLVKNGATAFISVERKLKYENRLCSKCKGSF